MDGQPVSLDGAPLPCYPYNRLLTGSSRWATSRDREEADGRDNRTTACLRDCEKILEHFREQMFQRGFILDTWSKQQNNQGRSSTIRSTEARRAGNNWISRN